MNYNAALVEVMEEQESMESIHDDSKCNKTISADEIASVLHRASLLTPPLWTLRDMVAVNPFIGYADRSILEAADSVQSRLGAHLLPTLKDAAHFFSEGAFSKFHIEKALTEKSYFNTANSNLPKLSADEVLQALNSKSGDKNFDTVALSCLTLVKYLDQTLTHPGKWQSDIIVDISRFCSSRFDQGVARWSCFKSEGLFKTWHAYAVSSRGMYARGLKSFHTYVKNLPIDCNDAVSKMLEDLGINSIAAAEEYICTLLGELPGWGGFLRQQTWQHAHDSAGELPELIAIRMAYDVAFYKDHRFASKVEKQVIRLRQPVKESVTNDKNKAITYALLRASEIAYLESVKQKFSTKKANKNIQATVARASAQIVLCIDVRSEILRRHVGEICPDIQTYGFAGFFGLPIQITDSNGNDQPQCPVLLQPYVAVKRDTTSLSVRNVSIKQLLQNISRSAHSCFTYVETIGFFSFFQMLKEVLTFAPNSNPRSVGAIKADSYSLVNIEYQRRVDLAKGILKNLGLKAPYARIVLLCGHDSQTENNPQAAGLACGACAGHSGAPNAHIAASILNDAHVRVGLSEESGWDIPTDTVFVPAIHNTVTDEVCILSDVPKTHQEDIQSLQLHLQRASVLVRKERSHKLGITDKDQTNQKLFSSLLLRGTDVAEVRPEWALAGNACFIAAKSEDLSGVNLEGRSFLHNYDTLLDHDGSVLETILTAPVVVASWINLQYFASAVDPEHFGSGTKTIHNIAAGVGVVCGNDGDLAAGLSRQSVHDGVHLQHQPLRLQVLVQAPTSRIDTIIEKHSFLKDLIKNEWILLYAADDSLDQCRRWIGTGEWTATV